MKIKVIQGSGNNLSPDPIIDELMSTEVPATERGRNYLAKESTHKWNYDIDMVYNAWQEIGSLVEVNDSDLGEVFRGKLTSFSLTVSFSEKDGPSSNVSISIERSEEYSE